MIIVRLKGWRHRVVDHGATRVWQHAAADFSADFQNSSRNAIHVVAESHGLVARAVYAVRVVLVERVRVDPQLQKNKNNNNNYKCKLS